MIEIIFKGLMSLLKLIVLIFVVVIIIQINMNSSNKWINNIYNDKNS